MKRPASMSSRARSFTPAISGKDGGVQTGVRRELPGGLTVVADIDPGILVDDVGHWPDQRIDRVRPVRPAWPGGPAEAPRFAELDAITASEVLADLAGVTTG
ncbi:hypothetical protein GWI34_11155 [Actinomadura sp. DSM 109109]|nr:hypothetical protein [Actinomadura lepetitiana]